MSKESSDLFPFRILPFIITGLYLYDMSYLTSFELIKCNACYIFVLSLMLPPLSGFLWFTWFGLFTCSDKSRIYYESWLFPLVFLTLSRKFSLRRMTLESQEVPMPPLLVLSWWVPRLKYFSATLCPRMGVIGPTKNLSYMLWVTGRLSVRAPSPEQLGYRSRSRMVYLLVSSIFFGWS